MIILEVHFFPAQENPCHKILRQGKLLLLKNSTSDRQKGVFILRQRVLALILLIILALSVASCGKNPAPVTEPPLEGDLTELATDFVSRLNGGDFAGAVSFFDATMKKTLPEEKLAETWAGLQEQMGPYSENTGTRTDTVKGYDIVFVTARFGTNLIDIRVVFNYNKRVAGLFFQPAQAPVGEAYAPPAYTDPDRFTERDVTVGRGQWALPGTLTLPATSGPHPAVILVHGSGPNDRDISYGPNKPFMDLAWGLATQGIAVLRYDKRTYVHGDKMNPENITVWEEAIDDAAAAVALLKSTPDIDPSQIFIAGHSLGGLVAPRIAGKEPAVAGLILLAAAARPLEDIIMAQYLYRAEADGTISNREEAQMEVMKNRIALVKDPGLKTSVPSSELPLGLPASYWLDLRGYSPAETAKTIKRPMLVLQGERDYQVTMDDFVLWHSALGTRSDVEFISYPGLNHLFFYGDKPSMPQEYQLPGHVAEPVIHDIANWVKRVISPL